MTRFDVQSFVVRMVLLLVPALGGCAGSLLKQAQIDFPCKQIVEKGIGDGLRKVSGCGLENVYGFNDKWQSPKERAAFDMDCPRDKLEVHELGSHAVGVSGCGKKATYVANVICTDQWGCRFKSWTMDSAAFANCPSVEPIIGR